MLPKQKTIFPIAFLLAASALLLLLSVFVCLKARRIADQNDYAMIDRIIEMEPAKNAAYEPQSAMVAAIRACRHQLKEPAQLFDTGYPLVFLDATGQLHSIIQAISCGPLYTFPYSWVDQHNLDITSLTLQTEDPDKDGFTNLDEWRGMDPTLPDSQLVRQSTDPNDPNSHPPYPTKLFLSRVVSEPLNIQFNSRSGDVFGIHAGGAYQSLKIGDMIVESGPGQSVKRRYKIVDFKEKAAKHPTLEMTVDVSELTIRNEETGDVITLVYGKTSCYSFTSVNLSFEWDKTKLPALKKGDQFSLKPEKEIKYTLLEIQGASAVIRNEKTGVTFKISPLPIIP